MSIEITKSQPLYAPLIWVIRAMNRGQSNRVILSHLMIEEDRIYATNGRQLHVYSGDHGNIPPGLYNMTTTNINNVILELFSHDPQGETYPDIDKVIPDISNFNHVGISASTDNPIALNGAFSNVLKTMNDDLSVDKKFFILTCLNSNLTDCFIPSEDHHIRSQAGHRPGNQPLVFMGGFDYLAVINTIPLTAFK